MMTPCRLCCCCCPIAMIVWWTFLLLTIVGPASAATEVTFYLQLTPLQGGYSRPGRLILEDALQAFTPVIETIWTTQLEAIGGSWTSAAATSSNDFRFDVPQLLFPTGLEPTPELLKYGTNSYVQEVSLEGPSIIINNNVTINNALLLNWTSSAFADNAFLPYLQQQASNTDNDDEKSTIFNTVTQVVMLQPNEYIPTHSLQSHMEILNEPLHLEFGPTNIGFPAGPSSAFILQALDDFFDDIVVPSLQKSIHSHLQDQVDVFSIHSIYVSQTYFAIGSYDQQTGQLHDQFLTDKPSVVTSFTYSYGLTYWVPIGQETTTIATIQAESPLWVDEIFDSNNAFLPYLQRIRQWENITFASTIEVTQAPSESPTAFPTLSPSMSPSELPSISPTNAPTRLSTAVPTTKPTSSPTILEQPQPPMDTGLTESGGESVLDPQVSSSSTSAAGRQQYGEKNIIALLVMMMAGWAIHPGSWLA